MAERIKAFSGRTPAERPVPAIRQVTSGASGQHHVPELPAAELTSDRLRKAVAQHGALIVRNLFPADMSETMIPAIDNVLDACAKPDVEESAPSVYYNPPEILQTAMSPQELGNARGFHRNSGSAMCVEAPSIAETLLRLYEHHNVRNLIADYLNEEPCLSIKKWVLRRSRLPIVEAGWHQDGAFMGTAINSINMWLPLTTCGGDSGAPGMDVVPRRLEEIVSAEEACFDWSVNPQHVKHRFAESLPVSPVFHPGDAFFFDHLYLHRTQFGKTFTRDRYAVETWFFGASSFPRNQVPLAW